MTTSMKSLTAAALLVTLTGCGATCEGVEDDIQQISREIRADPESAWDRSDELEALRDKLVELGCL